MKLKGFTFDGKQAMMSIKLGSNDISFIFFKLPAQGYMIRIISNNRHTKDIVITKD